MPVALITGANRGIGLALTNEFLVRGWRVIACCRQPDDAAGLRGLELSGTCPEALEIMALDVDDPASVSALKAHLGDAPIDLLINNAGIMGDREHDTVGNMNYSAWEALFRINTLAPFRLAETLLPNLEASGNGQAANISSGLGSIASQEGYALPYSVSKAALNSAMKSLAAVLQGRVRVNLFSPGWVRTDMGGSSAPLSAQESAVALFTNITGRGRADSGQFLDIDGKPLPW